MEIISWVMNRNRTGRTIKKNGGRINPLRQGMKQGWKNSVTLRCVVWVRLPVRLYNPPPFSLTSLFPPPPRGGGNKKGPASFPWAWTKVWPPSEEATGFQVSILCICRLFNFPFGAPISGFGTRHFKLFLFLPGEETVPTPAIVSDCLDDFGTRQILNWQNSRRLFGWLVPYKLCETINFMCCIEARWNRRGLCPGGVSLSLLQYYFVDG